MNNFNYLKFNEIHLRVKKLYPTGVSDIYDSKIYTDIFIEDFILFNNLCNPSKILDFGCGRGLTSLLLNLFKHNVIGLEIDTNKFDINKSSYSFNKPIQEIIFKKLETKKLNFKFYDGNKIPFKDDTFDNIFAYAAIEHCIDPELTISELKRVLKRNGVLFISRFPNKYSYLELIAKKFNLGHHEFKYSSKELRNATKEFELILHELIDFFPSSLISNRMNDKYYKFSKIFFNLDKIIRRTPIRHISHHHRIILKKK